jgi:protein TonB
MPVSAGERCVPEIQRPGRATAALLLIGSLALHAAAIAAFNTGPRPMPSAGIPAISVDIVLGDRSAAGLARESATEAQPTDVARAEVTDTAPEQVVPAANAAEVQPVAPNEIAAMQVPAVMPPRAGPAAPSAASGIGHGGSASDANYYGRVAAHLARHKRFPPDARRRGEHGSAEIDFSIDAGGRVMVVQIARSSGYASLDQAAEAMVWWASPFPAPPDRSPQRFTVPISYSIR